jgi:hypothetical protein
VVFLLVRLHILTSTRTGSRQFSKRPASRKLLEGVGAKGNGHGRLRVEADIVGMLRREGRNGRRMDVGAFDRVSEIIVAFAAVQSARGGEGRADGRGSVGEGVHERVSDAANAAEDGRRGEGEVLLLESDGERSSTRRLFLSQAPSSTVLLLLSDTEGSTPSSRRRTRRFDVVRAGVVAHRFAIDLDDGVVRPLAQPASQRRPFGLPPLLHYPLFVRSMRKRGRWWRGTRTGDSSDGGRFGDLVEVASLLKPVDLAPPRCCPSESRDPATGGGRGWTIGMSGTGGEGMVGEGRVEGTLSVARAASGEPVRAQSSDVEETVEDRRAPTRFGVKV